MLRKANDGKSSGALFSGIAGDSMQQVVLCSDWCASTGKTRIHHLTRKDPEEVTSSTGKRSAEKLACCVWKGGKSVSSYLSLQPPGTVELSCCSCALGGTETTWTPRQADRAPCQQATAPGRTTTPSTLASSSQRGFMLNHQLVKSYRGCRPPAPPLITPS